MGKIVVPTQDGADGFWGRAADIAAEANEPGWRASAKKKDNAPGSG